MSVSIAEGSGDIKAGPPTQAPTGAPSQGIPPIAPLASTGLQQSAIGSLPAPTAAAQNAPAEPSRPSCNSVPTPSAAGNGTSVAKQQLGAYSSREDFLMRQEQAGELSFKYVLNNGEPQNMVWCASGSWGGG